MSPLEKAAITSVIVKLFCYCNHQVKISVYQIFWFLTKYSQKNRTIDNWTMQWNDTMEFSEFDYLLINSLSNKS